MYCFIHNENPQSVPLYLSMINSVCMCIMYNCIILITCACPYHTIYVLGMITGRWKWRCISYFVNMLQSLDMFIQPQLVFQPLVWACIGLNVLLTLIALQDSVISNPHRQQLLIACQSIKLKFISPSCSSSFSTIQFVKWTNDWLFLWTWISITGNANIWPVDVLIAKLFYFGFAGPANSFSIGYLTGAIEIISEVDKP